MRKATNELSHLVFVPYGTAGGPVFRDRPESGSVNGVTLLEQTLDLLSTPGAQVAVVGESGVGKTSLLNRALLELNLTAARVPCMTGMTLDDIAGFVLSHTKFERNTARTTSTSGSLGLSTTTTSRGGDRSFEIVTPGVAQALHQALSAANVDILILESFHSITDSEVKLAVSQLMEMFSNNGRLKIVLDGAADAVADLVTVNASTGDRVVEIYVPRMSNLEVRSIYEYGFRTLNLNADGTMMLQLEFIADQLPRFAHRVGHWVAQTMIRENSSELTQDILKRSLERLARANGSSQLSRFQDAAEPDGDPRPRKAILYLLAQSDVQREWTASEVATLWDNRHTDDPTDVDEIERHLRQLCSDDFGRLMRSRKVGKNRTFGFDTPLTPVWLRVFAIIESQSADYHLAL